MGHNVVLVSVMRPIWYPCQHTGAPGSPLTGLPLSCWHRLILAGFHGFSPLLWAAVIQKAHIPFFTSHAYVQQPDPAP